MSTWNALIFVLPYLQSEFALEAAAFDVMEQAFEDGVAYIEIRLLLVSQWNRVFPAHKRFKQ